MTLTNKILLFLGGVVLLGLLGFIIYQQHQISTQQQAIQEQVVKQKDLIDGIVRSQDEYATKKDIEQFAKDNGVNLKAVQDDLDKLRANVSAVNVISVGSSGQNGHDLSSTGTGATNPNPGNQPDPFGYLKNEQRLTLNEDFTSPNANTTLPVPIGDVGFSAWKDKPWSLSIPPREYHVVNVVGTDENQRNYFYNRFSIKVNNKEYDVKIASAETKQEFPQAKFSWWNPRLFARGDVLVNTSLPIKGDVVPGIALGIMSYGRFKTTPDISLMQVGVGYGINERVVSFGLAPVNFNIGKLFPTGIVDSTYIGPSIQINTHGQVGLGAGLSVGF